MSSEEDRSGFGRFEYPDGSVYEGEWISQNGVKIREGKGNLIQPYREEFLGEWKNDQMHGKGSYHYTSGSFYDGDWENGKAHGKGVYEFQDGSIYDGEWKDHKMHGFGCFIDRFSNKWEGEFVNGVYQSKIQEQLKIEKIEQQKINDVLLNCMPFFQKFDQKFSVSDKKTFKDNMTPFFTNSDEIGHLYKGNLPKFEDKQPQVWRDTIMKFSEDHVNINVLKKIQDSLQLDHQNIFAQQLNNNGQIVEFEKISQKKLQLCLCNIQGRWVIIHHLEE